METMALVKLFSFAPADTSDDNVGYLLRYFKLMKEYLGIKCFIVQNLHIYLDDSECENLLESAVMHGIYLLNIENSVPKEVSEYEKLVVIDNDLCEFY
nr:type II-A CRISPR-associated protein Csn2 [Ruminococcus sp. AF43-11]